MELRFKPKLTVSRKTRPLSTRLVRNLRKMRVLETRIIAGGRSSGAGQFDCDRGGTSDTGFLVGPIGNAGLPGVRFTPPDGDRCIVIKLGFGRPVPG